MKYSIQHTFKQARGFTLMELMFAISILGVGLIAVASIFPVAGIIQRETVYTLMSQQVNDNVRVALSTRGISTSELIKANSSSKYYEILRPLPEKMLANESSNNELHWSIADRTFPAKEENPLLRPYAWVPMVLKDKSSWKLFVFIVRVSKDFDYKRFGSDSDWANPKDGETRIFGNKVYRIPGIKQYRASIDTSDDDLRTLLIPTSRGAIQIGSKIVTDTGKILSVTLVSGNNLEKIRVSSRLQNERISNIWTAVGQPTQVSGSSAKVDMPNPLVDVVVVGQEAFKP